MKLYCGDCLDVMREMPEKSVDAIVTDPPYGLEFMGKEWDKLEPARNKQRWKGTERKLIGNGSGKGGNFAERFGEMPQYRPNRNKKCRICGHYKFSGTPCQCKNPDWDDRKDEHSLAMQEWHYEWAVEALRVCKPGAHMLAFGGTRTHHRLMVAIEDAGWEIRDTLGWLYGSGFPKSLDVSKAIDKHDGKQIGWFGVWLRKWREDNHISQKEIAALFPSKTGGLTGCVANWELGLNLPTIQQFNLIRDTFNLPFEHLDDIEREIVGQRTTGIGTGKGSTPIMGDGNRDITTPRTDAAKQWNGYGTALKPAWEPIILCRKPLEGTVAENVQKWGTGAINIDGCRVDATGYALGGQNRSVAFGMNGLTDKQPRCNGSKGRFPANLIHDGSDEVLALFPDTQPSKGRYVRKTGDEQFLGVMGDGRTNEPDGLNDSGSAARFFYTAKADSEERNKYLNGKNKHPTVKPIDLLRYLCRLITPPNGAVLDMFAGSGSTGVAAFEEGFDYILIEKDPESFETARIRNGQVRLPI